MIAPRSARGDRGKAERKMTITEWIAAMNRSDEEIKRAIAAQLNEGTRLWQIVNQAKLKP